MRGLVRDEPQCIAVQSAHDLRDNKSRHDQRDQWPQASAKPADEEARDVCWMDCIIECKASDQ